MSRIGKQPIALPAKVKCTVDGLTVSVEGPKGKLTRTLPDGVAVALEGQNVVVTRKAEDAQTRAIHGLARSLLAGMVKGVAEGYKKELLINGVGYRADLAGSTLTLKLGYTNDRIFNVPAGVNIKIEDKNTRIIIEGADKEAVGQSAAKIRAFKKPDPYKIKGVRYVGEKVIQKEGKTGGK